MLECRRIAADDGVNPGGTRSDNMAVIQGRLASPRLSFLSPIHLVWKRRARGNKNRYKGFFIVDSDPFSKGGTVAEQRGICRIRRIISDRRR
jgi:hypothetical protein